MGPWCCVKGCSSNSRDKIYRGVRFFSFPTWKRGYGPQTEDITKRRRAAWVAAIRRKDITFDKISPYVRVCSRHFHKGQPAYEMMESDPDWAPSLHLGHTNIKPTDTARSARRRAGEQLRKKTLQVAETGLHRTEDVIKQQTNEVTQDLLQTDERTQKASGRLSTEDETHSSRLEQTGCNLCVFRCAEVNRLVEENQMLQRELDELQMSDGFFGDNDNKVKYYTGLPNLATFMALFDFLLPLMSAQNNKILSPFQMLLLTFMRLRLDLPSQHLAHLFQVSTKTVHRTFNEMFSFLYENLKGAIVWPDRDTLYKMMPPQFVEAFGHRVAVIVHCFEIFTEKPATLKTHGQMFSSYKHNPSMKYLIGITPKGAICFLSKGWGGRTSDKHITLNSGFLNKLFPGDVILADRGFDIQEDVGMLCAEVKLPAFTKSRCQLAVRGGEETRKITHLRLHVETLIANVCQKYKILTGAIPINMVVPCEGEDASILDKIVTVCCALTNHSLTIT